MPPDPSAAPVVNTPPPASSGQDMGGASLPARQFTAPSQTDIPQPAASGPSAGPSPSSAQVSALGAPPGMGGAARQFNAPPQTVVPQPPALSPDAQQSMAIGAAIKGVHGAMDPNQNKPGSIWRTILSAALVGAAAGAGHGWQGAGLGAEAENKVVERQQALKQEQFKNQMEQQKQDLEKKKDARETNVAESDMSYRKALTAQANQTTLKDALDVQGKSQAQHDLLAERDKPELDMFHAAGIKPVQGYENIRESDAVKMQHEPGFTGKRWLVTGVVPTRDENGNITSYENTYSVYDPDKTLTLTDSQVKQWRQDGLLDANPNLMTSNVVTKDPATGQMTIKYADYRNLQAQAGPLRQARLSREEQDYMTQHEKDQTKLIEAQTRAENARTTAEQTTSGKAAWEFKQEKDATSARRVYQAKGWDGLNPDQMVLLQGDIRQNISDAEKLLNSAELKVEENSMDPGTQKAAYDKAHDLRQTIEEESRKLISNAVKTQATAAPASADTNTTSGLLNTVKGYVSSDAKPVLEKYIAGSSSYDQFVSSLASAQANLPSETKIPSTDYQSLLSAGKSYYDNLPKVQQKTSQEDVARKLATARAKNPDRNVTEDDLANYDNEGNFVPGKRTYHGR